MIFSYMFDELKKNQYILIVLNNINNQLSENVHSDNFLIQFDKFRGPWLENSMNVNA